eukprot:g7395.t1
MRLSPPGVSRAGGGSGAGAGGGDNMPAHRFLPALFAICVLAPCAQSNLRGELAASGGASAAIHKIHIRALFETGCPDSQNFIENALAPVVEHLHGFVDVELLPWGKVTLKGKSRADTYTALRAGAGDASTLEWSCQHGAQECEGNRLALCAVDQAGGDGLRAFAFVNCLMKHFWSKSEWPQCKEEGAEYASLKSCADSAHAKRLFLKAGEATVSATPMPPKYVPWVQISGHHMHCPHGCDLLHLICSAAEDARWHPKCKGLAKWEEEQKANPARVPCLNGGGEVPHGWSGEGKGAHAGKTCKCNFGWMRCEADAVASAGGGGAAAGTAPSDTVPDAGLGPKCKHITCLMHLHMHADGKVHHKVQKHHVDEAPP